MITVSLSELFRTDKDEYYNLVGLTTNVPVILAGWLEATTCEKFLVNYGGHVWYDQTIALSLFSYALGVAYMHSKSSIQKISPDKSTNKKE